MTPNQPIKLFGLLILALRFSNFSVKIGAAKLASNWRLIWRLTFLSFSNSMYVMCILLVWVALKTCWSDAEPAYKADSASPPPVVLRRLSLCSLHFCISSDIINKCVARTD